MIVRWNGNGVKIIPLKTTGATAKERDKVSKKGMVMLIPGINDVPDNDWAVAEIHLKDDILEKRVEIMGEVKPIDRDFPKSKKRKSLKSTGVAFKDLSVEDACEVVEETNNLQTLTEWLKDENRDSVRATIKNRIETVEIDMKKGKVSSGAGNAESIDKKDKKNRKKGKSNLFERKPLTEAEAKGE